MGEPLSSVEISRDALLHNLEAFRAVIGGGKPLIPVIKANAYGHGQQEVTSILEPHAELFQLDDVNELLLFRKHCARTPLVLGHVAPFEVDEVVMSGAVTGIFDPDQIALYDRAAERLGRRVTVHLAIDALFGREGLPPSAVPSCIEKFRASGRVDLAGVYGHLSSADDDPGLRRSSAQSAAFSAAVDALRRGGYDRILTHFEATSGLLAFADHSAHGAARLGLGLYGVYPSEGLRRSDIDLRPVMRWRTRVAQVKTLPAGHPVGYGATFETMTTTTIAIVPLGYSDGYDRRLSGKGEVLIRGARCPVLGRVSMNMFPVDVSHVPGVAAGDEVVLLGSQGGEAITVEELAGKMGTITYEVTTGISPLLPRVIV